MGFTQLRRYPHAMIGAPVIRPPAEFGSPGYIAWAHAVRRPHDVKVFYLFDQPHTNDGLWHDGREYVVTHVFVRYKLKRARLVSGGNRMKFAIACTGLIACLVIMSSAALLGRELIAGLTAIGLIICGFAVNRLAGARNDESNDT
jgi:hypothetical protein